MKISMLMPVYNCPPELLEKAIVSIMQQAHQDYEIVIKDGDLTHPAVGDSRIAGLFHTLGPKIQYGLSLDSRSEGHSGFYQALNWCMKAATGDIFSFQAGDDERGEPDVLSYVNEQFEQHGPSPFSPFLLYGDYERINLDSSHHSVLQPGSGQPVSNPIAFEEFFTDNRLLTPAVFWNRGVYEKFGLFDEKYDWIADFEYWLRIWRGIDKAYAPRTLGRYRMWETSEQRKNAQLSAQQGYEIVAKYRATL